MMNGGAFSENLQKYLRAGGYAQRELANELGLHPKVLSRKLNSTGNAYLNYLEIKQIIVTLAKWGTITTRDQAISLLAMVEVESSIFTAEEWQDAPLNKLTIRRTSTALSGLPDLPAPATRLIGRDRAVTDLLQLLERDEVRLVTLVGAGGSGKTRLALHVAHELVQKFAQAVCFVPLASVHNPDLVPISIIQALNIKSSPTLSPRQSLITYLHGKQLTLVLDNFEQVRTATDTLNELLTALPGLKMLVTSRAVLHIYGEHEVSVPPLDLPRDDLELTSAELAQYGAIQLFVERAQAVRSDFTLTDENAAVVAKICARVDGLPLTLELAAARMKILLPTLLLQRLSQARLTVLTNGVRNQPDRHQTLHNTISWSYNQLSPTAQAWFRRLSTFTGSWSLEAAEAMMQGNIKIEPFSTPLDLLEQLVDNSLLVRLPDTNSQVRFMMLETLREYAREELKNHDELEQWQDWHTWYFLREAETAEAGLRGPQQLLWRERLIADRDNFHRAEEWSLQKASKGLKMRFFSDLNPDEDHQYASLHEAIFLQHESSDETTTLEICLRLTAAFCTYWEWQGYLNEGRDWLNLALDIPLTRPAGAGLLAARAKALSVAARLTSLQNDQVKSHTLSTESISIWQQLNEPRGLALAQLHRGWASHAQEDYETAKRAYQDGLSVLSPEKDTWFYAQLLFHLAAICGFTSDFEQMHSCYMQSWELFEQVGDKCALADLLKDRGGLLIIEGKHREAITSLLKSILLCYEMNHRQFMATGMGWLSFAFGLLEEPDPVQASIYSAQLEGAADSLMSTIGLNPWLKTHSLTTLVRQAIRSRIDEQSWQHAWATGRALTFDQAVELAQHLARTIH